MASLKSLAFVSVLALGSGFATRAAAVPFTPVIDEFWIVKNDTEIFRDSFDDGVLPPDGPDGSATYGPASGGGHAGFTSEAGGKLTITPSLGDPTLIAGDPHTVTRAARTRSVGPSPDTLGPGASFEMHGLFDLTSLPSMASQAFGIRATDRDPALVNPGNNVIDMWVTKGVSGNLGVRLLDIDFTDPFHSPSGSADPADFVPIQSFIGTATQIELIISSAANDNTVTAEFLLYDASSAVIFSSGAMDTFNNRTGEQIVLYDGENYTRAAFVAFDVAAVPSPASVALFGVGLAALGALRRRRR